MEYPLLISGERAGSLSVEREGLYTLMEAWTDRRGELKRIWVHGGGAPGYLGVLQPWSGGMYLKRRLSRRDMEGFPPSIELASDQPGQHFAPPASEPDREPPPAPRSFAQGQSEEELLWFSRPDGSLTAFDGSGSLIALPAELRRRVPGTDIRRINGGEYMVFRY